VQGYAEAIDTNMADGFQDGAFMGIGTAGTAIFFRHGGAQKPVLAGKLPDGTVKNFLLLETVVVRQHLGFEKLRSHVLQHHHIVSLPVGFWHAQHVFRPNRHL
jgi:hypothetical protein